jgi:hypothetical protein
MDDGLRLQCVGLVIVRGVAVIIENLPPDLPVLEAELAVLETYLGDIIDEVLAKIERDSQLREGVTAQRGEY